MEGLSPLLVVASSDGDSTEAWIGDCGFFFRFPGFLDEWLLGITESANHRVPVAGVEVRVADLEGANPLRAVYARPGSSGLVSQRLSRLLSRLHGGLRKLMLSPSIILRIGHKSIDSIDAYLRPASNQVQS